MTCFPFPRPAHVAAGLLALALAATAHAERVDGVPVDAAFKPAERAQTLIDVTGADAGALRGIRRAALSSFQVEFITKGAAGATSREIGRSGSASTNLQITLVGLTPADHQAITDRLHAEFVSDLQAQGIEVVPTERIVAAAAYKKMAATGKPSPTDTRTSNTWSTVYAPQGLAIYGAGSSSNAIGILAGFTALSDASATMFGNGELATELDAAAITVRMVVNFVDLKSSNSSWFGRTSGTASVSGEVTASVEGGSSFMAVHRPTGSAMMTLRAPLLVDGAAFSGVKDTTSIAANVGLALLSLAIGQGGSATAIEKEAVADPARYRELVGGGVGSARAMFMERLRAAK